MSEFVTVNCSVPNGIVLRNYAEARRSDNGEVRFMPVGDPVELRPGENQVDKKFFSTWLAANSDNDLVVNKLVQGPEQEN